MIKKLDYDDVQFIKTGYMICGATWLSQKWNDGTLTKEDLVTELDETQEELDLYLKYTDDDVRDCETKYAMDCALEEMPEDYSYDEDPTNPQYLKLYMENWERLSESAIDNQENEVNYLKGYAECLHNAIENFDDDDLVDYICEAHGF